LFRIVFLLLLFPLFTFATELKPWYGDPLVINARFTSAYQHYSRVAKNHHPVHHSSDDLFQVLSVETSLFEYGLEGELYLAKTHHRSFGLDSFKLTGRYQILNNDLGDPVSLILGASLIAVDRWARDDLSVFHHGGTEGEFTVSVGNEVICEDIWLSRWWCVGGLGLGDTGSPWIRGDASYEKRFYTRHFLRLTVDTLWGLGHSNLHVHDFDGYGPIQHQSVDLTLRYAYQFDYLGELSCSYSYRLFARNAPLEANRFQVTYLYPFGL
jgi:hypothetical protein